MTRTEYLEKLREQLHCFSSDMQEEILEDYNRHFDEGLANGKSEDEIIACLMKSSVIVLFFISFPPFLHISYQRGAASLDFQLFN